MRGGGVLGGGSKGWPRDGSTGKFLPPARGDVWPGMVGGFRVLVLTFVDGAGCAHGVSMSDVLPGSDRLIAVSRSDVDVEVFLMGADLAVGWLLGWGESEGLRLLGSTVVGAPLLLSLSDPADLRLVMRLVFQSAGIVVGGRG